MDLIYVEKLLISLDNAATVAAARQREPTDHVVDVVVGAPAAVHHADRKFDGMDSKHACGMPIYMVTSPKFNMEPYKSHIHYVDFLDRTFFGSHFEGSMLN